MRGAAFIGGEGPAPDLGRCVLGEVDLVVAADSGLVATENWGFKADWIVGDMDSIDDIRRLSRYPADRVLKYPSDKDYTDTELAVSLLHEKGCDEVVLVGGGGGRLDHTLAIAALFDRENAPDRWITAREDVRFISAENLKDAGKEKTALLATVSPGALISLFPVGLGPWKARSRGLKWPLDDLPWSRGFFGISNIAQDGSFSVIAKSGRFLVVLPLV